MAYDFKPCDKEGKSIDLLQLYGTIYLDDLKTTCKFYIDQQTRDAQNSAQMYQCIMSSLSEVGKKTIANENNEYTESNIKSRPLLYKVITSKVIMDNRYTTNHLRYQIGALDTYIYESGNDILKFNQYVQGLELSFKTREEKAEDLNLNLFTGYEACSDETFRQYISKNRDDYEEG